MDTHERPNVAARSAAVAAPQVWGGLECTINRVGDHWSDQDNYSRHGERGIGDLELFESLHIEKLRYPVLWEKIAPESPEKVDFGAVDDQMRYLHASSIDPIVGMLHHGSGPRYTSLIDPGFPEAFARYAGQVARRYPWVQYYTPINEPLTTARFSGLYGVWYPHGRDDATFLRALYTEVRATVLAMREIRRVNPLARLVQTDDLGRTTGTAVTDGQVAFENERRWLGFDLLMGSVTTRHPLHRYLRDEGGLTDDELDWLVDNPCPPDIVGVNHYLLSNRFLDHELDWYPHDVRAAANGSCQVDYADVAALDTGRAASPSVEDVLRDAWARYPETALAVTEVHVNGAPGTQMRWLWEVWSAAQRLHEEGAPIAAVTVWGLLGSFDWNTLCTTPPGGDVLYEPGVFDISDSLPRPTGLTDMVRSLATTRSYEHDALAGDGYWRDPGRLLWAVRTDDSTPEELAS